MPIIIIAVGRIVPMTAAPSPIVGFVIKPETVIVPGTVPDVPTVIIIIVAAVVIAYVDANPHVCMDSTL
jgi:hypothetical protein